MFIRTVPKVAQFLFNWLCSVCSFRAELLEIWREIYSIKEECIKTGGAEDKSAVSSDVFKIIL